MLNFGIIGTGNIGRAHIEAIGRMADARILRAVSPSCREDTRRWLEDRGILEYTQDPEDIFTDPRIDAVLIASPTATHTDYSVRALRAGKHVFCEKPISVDASGIQPVADAIRESGKKFQIGFMKRFDHNHGLLVEAAASGRLGRLQTARITSRDPQPPALSYLKGSGGIFLDMMIHDIDLSRCLLCSEAAQVYARGGALTDPAFAEIGDWDTAAATITMENGAMAVIENTRSCAYGYDQRVEVFGTKGMMNTGNDAPSHTCLATREGYVTPRPVGFYMDRYKNAYTAEITAFVKAVTEDAPTPVGIRDAYEDYVIALAATRSARENRPVETREIREALAIRF